MRSSIIKPLIWGFFVLSIISLTSCQKDYPANNDEVITLLKEMKKSDSLLLVSFKGLQKQVDSLLKVTGTNTSQLNLLKSTLDSVLTRLATIQAQLNSQSSNIVNIQTQLNELLLLYQSLLVQISSLSCKPSVADSVKMGLLAYYAFDNSLVDSVANPANGQGFGTWSYVSNRNNIVSKALEISNGYISLSNSSKLQFSKDDSFTVAGWINIGSQTNGGRILSSENTEGNLRFTVWSSGTKKRVDWAFGNSMVSTDSLGIDKWYHFCYTYSTTGSKIYINETLINENTVANTEVRTYSGYRFGQKNSSSFDQYYGKIDNIRFYNRKLSISEQKYLLNN
jgi:hypothetical protein